MIVSLENLSLCDSFWFHHIFLLRYETTATQMRSVLQGIASLIETEGARLAIPMQTAYLAVSSGSDLSSVQSLLDTSGPHGSKQNRDAA